MAFINPTTQNDQSAQAQDSTAPIQPQVSAASPLFMQSQIKETIGLPVQSTQPEGELKPESPQLNNAQSIEENLQTDQKEINVDSIISEISENLSSANLESKVKTEADNNPAVQPSSLLTYNLNASDTFQENYKNQIEIGTPVKIDSNNEGVKEIKALDSSIPSSIINDALSVQNLKYKNYTLAEILTEAINIKASDVHLTPGYRATFRIDGKLKTFNSPILTANNVKDYALEIIKSRKDIDLALIKQVDMTYTLGSKRFRVNIFKQMGVFSIVCRVINETIASIDNLGLPVNISNLVKFPNGLILVTGPTGSGKSTTIASLLNAVNLTDSKHIITLEDPVEYVIPKGLSLIDQREFGTDFTSWPDALRAVLRQDPDIVLIGEMRDLESVEAALQVAETGHLVFATLHTNSASQSIDRIIDIFPAEKQDQIRIQLASVLRAVVSQRLIPLAQGGRHPAVEVVITNTAIQNAIRESKVFLIDNVIQTSAEEGMISLEKSLVQLVKEGKISAQTAKGFSLRPNEIDMLLTR